MVHGAGDGCETRGPFGSEPQPRITTPCPSCGTQSLFIGNGGGLTCSVLGCKSPGVEDTVRKFAHLFGRMTMAVLQGNLEEARGIAEYVRVDFDEKGPYVSGRRR